MGALHHTSLEMLVVQALQQGQSDAYIDTIVNEAAKAGTITIPQGLATANGTVDTAVLLYSLIEKARAAAGEPPLPPTGANTEPRWHLIKTQTNASTQ